MRACAGKNLCDACKTDSAVDAEIHVLVFVMFAYFCIILLIYANHVEILRSLEACLARNLEVYMAGHDVVQRVKSLLLIPLGTSAQPFGSPDDIRSSC